MTMNEVSRNRPEIISCFNHHRASSRLEVGLENVIQLTFLQEFPFLLLVPGRSRIKVDVLRRRSLPKMLTVPSATENMKLPLLCGVNTSFALSLRAWSSDASISSNFFNVCDHNDSFPDSNPHTRHNRGFYLGRLLVQTDAVWIGLSQK